MPLTVWLDLVSGYMPLSSRHIVTLLDAQHSKNPLQKAVLQSKEPMFSCIVPLSILWILKRFQLAECGHE